VIAPGAMVLEHDLEAMEKPCRRVPNGIDGRSRIELTGPERLRLGSTMRIMTVNRGCAGAAIIRAMRGCLALACAVSLSASCSPEDQRDRDVPREALFRMLPPSETGIQFRNTLSERPTPHRTELLYEYFSNGGGVAVGDLNGDGLADLYFTGNMTYNGLFLNRGGMRFEDVTRVAGVAGRPNTWKTGVTFADVDGDGLLDIYVAYSGDLPLERRVDELYINQGSDENGIPRFAERARAYGLASPHSSNQAYFFDYDRDGDLDLFLQTHNVTATSYVHVNAGRWRMEQEDPVNGLRFYRNDDGHFDDVTSQVGISSSPYTYGLGAGISDIDKDGWIDMYVGNDYSPPDYLYMNNGDGTFSDELGSRMGHTPNASMGVDVADIDNDGWSDILVLDMLAEDNRRQKTLLVPNDRTLFETFVQSGFHHQYMRNMLQLNNGDGTFSEIGQLAGVSNTDWSWAPLIADLDNDGKKDLFVTNGTLHDVLDLHFLDFKRDYVARKGQLGPDDIAALMEALPSSDVPNYAFRNEGDLRFRDVSSHWGLDVPLKSTGAAYADLDNDGDLDLVTNNINEYPSVFENRTADASGNNYLQIRLEGTGPNTFGVGAKLTVYAGGGKQYAEQMPTRGYLSTVSPILHFGLGALAAIDSLQVVWPDGRAESLVAVEANRRITVRQEDAVEVEHAVEANDDSPTIFEEMPSPIEFEHRMAGWIDDFRRQPLLDHPKSFLGPALAKADVNGDGLVDVFAGGGNGQAGKLYLQQPDGRFAGVPQPALDADRRSHDVEALFLDCNRDGFLDLYVASGGYGSFEPGDAALQDRLYVNDGEGNFTRAENALPEMRTSTGAVALSDIDRDGWPDLFVGGYVSPGRYPEQPRSYVLLNDGRGRFEERTAEVGAGLEHVGMVTDAAWHDLDRDGAEELIVVGQWMPIRIFESSGGMLRDVTEDSFDQPYNGLWNVVHVEDLNGDGIADLIAGNLGLNSQIRAGEDQPAELYYADFDFNGSVDPILSFYIQGIRYPHLTLDELRERMPAVASRFASYRAYAEAETPDLLEASDMERPQKLEATWLETSLFIGTGTGRFERRTLPVQAQFSPVFTVTTLDYDRDGHTDVVLGGNMNEARIRLGKHDANYGVLLRGLPNASFEYVPQYVSGLGVRGDVRSVLHIGDALLFGINRSAVRAFALVHARGD
jgi:hypothetical protein